MMDDLYCRLESLSKSLEGSGRLDEHENPDAYATILDAMNAIAEMERRCEAGVSIADLWDAWDELVDLKAEMEKAEPVAWMDDYGNTFGKQNDDYHIPLYTHPAIPEGWQLVPVEPTDHMRNEGRETYRNDGDELDIWLTMVAAAPKLGE